MVRPVALTKQSQVNAAVTEVIAELSPAVRRIRYEIGQDWEGEWAIYFRVLLSDDASRPANLREIAPRIIRGMSDRLDLPDLGMFPHFNFRSEAEQALFNEPAWA